MKIPNSNVHITKDDIDCVGDAVKSSWVSSTGKYIELFENSISDYVGSNYASATSSGTSALHLSLLALGTKQGDDVLVPNTTFVATANAVRYCGANVILYNNLDDIDKLITGKTTSIIVVHLFGIPENMSKVMKIANKYNLYVVEDACQALGGEYNGEKLGSIGDMGCFSFFANKIITTGEGGMVVCNNKKKIDKVNLYKNHGMSTTKKYWHNVVGYNYRMTNMQAALGYSQSRILDRYIEDRRRICRLYNSLLKQESNAIWLYPYKCQDTNEMNALYDKLQFNGVDARKMFYPLSEFEMYKSDMRVPNRNILMLPMYYGLETQKIWLICKLIKD